MNQTYIKWASSCVLKGATSFAIYYEDSFISKEEVPDKPTPDMLKACLDKVVESGQVFSLGLDGKNTFHIVAERDGDEIGKVAYQITSDGESSAIDNGNSINALVRNMSSHIAMCHKTIMAITPHLIKSHETQMNKQERMIEKLLDEKFNSFSLMQELLDNKSKRELEEIAAANNETRKDKILSKLQVLVPALIAGKTGNKQIAVDAIFESLTDEQKAVIFGALTDEQRAAFFTVMQQKKESDV